MVDLKGQYNKIQSEVDTAVLNVIKNAQFINGQEVKSFQSRLEAYLNNAYVIPCANGTDALQIAMMALELIPGDEVIVPAFTYVATAEVLALLGLKPVMVDVDPITYNITPEVIEAAITSKTKAIVPVHLFGQCAPMEEILKIANRYGLFVIEDNAQAIGAEYIFSNGERRKAGCIGDIGCTSFFPSKNLGCYGDGGALYTTNEKLATKIKMIANHGQEKKYVHKYVGVNSRLDTIQAAILEVKLKYLDQYSQARVDAANRYDQLLASVKQIRTPYRVPYSTHVFHQYTLFVKDHKRDQLKAYLDAAGIPNMIYYPIPLNQQEAYKEKGRVSGSLHNTEELCSGVLSLPMHTELTLQEQEHIASAIISFFKQ